MERNQTPTGPESVVVSKTEARQGETGHNVRYMVAFGLGGVVLAFAILGVVYFS